MATKPHEYQTLVETADLVRRAKGVIRHAAKLAGVPGSTFESRSRAALDAGIITREELTKLRTRERVTNIPAIRLPQTADECWAAIDAAIGRSAKRVKPAPQRGKMSSERIAIISDVHAPFHDVDALAEMFARTKGFDRLLVNGDLQDAYSLSRFTKHEPVPITVEMAAVDAILATASAQFPAVDISDGNHDGPRFEKLIRGQLDLEAIHAIEYLTGGNLSLIRCAAKRYPNVAFPKVQVGRHKVGWFQQRGDLIVTHAEKFSRVPGSALRGIEEWLSDRRDTLGLAPWRVLIQAHTHQMGHIPWSADKHLIEGGCLCSTHGYQLGAAIAGRPQRLGFVTLTQRDGVTDIDSIKLHFLDELARVA